MKGSSMPYAPAFKNGVCDTYSSGTFSQSKVVQTSVCSVQSRGNCVRPDAHGIALEEQPDAALAADHGEDLPDDFLGAGNAAEGLEGRAVGGVLPGDGADAGEGAARAGSGNGR